MQYRLLVLQPARTECSLPPLAESTLSLPIAIGTEAGSPKFLHLQTGVDKNPGSSVISTPVRRLTVTLTLPPPAGDNENLNFVKLYLKELNFFSIHSSRQLCTHWIFVSTSLFVNLSTVNPASSNAFCLCSSFFLISSSS